MAEEEADDHGTSTTKVTFSLTQTPDHGEDSEGLTDVEAYFGGESSFYGEGTSSGGTSYFEGASGSYGEYEESESLHRISRHTPKTDDMSGAPDSAAITADDASEIEDKKSKATSDLEFSVISSLDESSSSEQQAESIASSESVVIPVDREEYYANYLQGLLEYGVVKRVNNYLHKKMSEYFKKRKMEHVLREGAEHIEEALMKYGKKIDKFKELIDMDKAERESITAEVARQTETRDNLFIDAANNAVILMAREREIGTGLISEKTGKELPEKYMEKLINNQRSKAKELAQLRLTHIKIRNAVAEKHAALKALDKIGDNYTLIEFEQLKIENQGHADKIEERDEELAKLRKKCAGAIMCLAHIREKCSAIEVNIGLMKETLEEKQFERTDTREKMNKLKQQRDNYRIETQRLREDNGLMTKDKLLIDMDNALHEIDQLKSTIAVTQKRFQQKKTNLAMLKINYERELQRKKRGGVTSRENTTHVSLSSLGREPKQYKSRPSLYLPKFEETGDDFA